MSNINNINGIQNGQITKPMQNTGTAVGKVQEETYGNNNAVDNKNTKNGDTITIPLLNKEVKKSTAIIGGLITGLVIIGGIIAGKHHFDAKKLAVAANNAGSEGQKAGANGGNTGKAEQGAGGAGRNNGDTPIVIVEEDNGLINDAIKFADLDFKTKGNQGKAVVKETGELYTGVTKREIKTTGQNGDEIVRNIQYKYDNGELTQRTEKYIEDGKEMEKVLERLGKHHSRVFVRNINDGSAKVLFEQHMENGVLITKNSNGVETRYSKKILKNGNEIHDVTKNGIQTTVITNGKRGKEAREIKRIILDTVSNKDFEILTTLEHPVYKNGRAIYQKTKTKESDKISGEVYATIIEGDKKIIIDTRGEHITTTKLEGIKPDGAPDIEMTKRKHKQTNATEGKIIDRINNSETKFANDANSKWRFTANGDGSEVNIRTNKKTEKTITKTTKNGVRTVVETDKSGNFLRGRRYIKDTDGRITFIENIDKDKNATGGIKINQTIARENGDTEQSLVLYPSNKQIYIRKQEDIGTWQTKTPEHIYNYFCLPDGTYNLDIRNLDNTSKNICFLPQENMRKDYIYTDLENPDKITRLFTIQFDDSKKPISAKEVVSASPDKVIRNIEKDGLENISWLTKDELEDRYFNANTIAKRILDRKNF